MKTIFKYYKPHIWWIVLCLVLLFCEAMAELKLPKYMSDIINNGILLMDMPVIYSTGLYMILISLASVVCSLGVSFAAARVSAGAVRDIRAAEFRHVTYFATGEIDRFSTASLITRSTNDLQQIQNATVMTLRMALYAPIMGIGAIINAVRMCPSLTWTILVALIAILALMGVTFATTFPKFKVIQTMVDKLNLIMNERLSGTLVIRAFNRERYEESRFDDANEDLTKLNIFVNRAMATLMPVMMLFMNFCSILIVWVGAEYIDGGTLSVGNMLAFIQYAMQVIISFLFITMIFIFLPRAAVSMQRVGEVLNTEISVKDKSDEARDKTCDCPTTVHEAENKLLGEARSSVYVEFKNVSFKYEDAEENVLTDISFVAEQGKTTAFIGATGSGKSTLVNLIPRFYDVTEGSITVNGCDIRDIPQKQLRKMIGYVPQKAVLFTGTIEENIAYGGPYITHEDVVAAAETSQALDFINEKDDGFDTAVSQGGTNVSGGQKQRLSIARALAKKPPLYIFDDSFSALDFKTDAGLRRALARYSADSTVIIVAQRIGTIMNADKIVVLDEGRMVGSGTHDELMKGCEVYREIASSQLDAEHTEGRTE